MRHPTAPLLLWQDAGSPPVTKAAEPFDGPCYLCGNVSPTGSAVRARDVFGPKFTDHDRARAPGSAHVCVPCVWSLGGKPPDTFRLWSIVYRGDRPAATSNPKAVYAHGPHTHLTSKSDVSEIVDVLLDPPNSPWVCAVAESGQIHILPWSRVNVGSSWSVLYERERVDSDSVTFAGVMHHVCALLAAGFIREDVETLDPHPSKLVKHGIAVWREHARPLEQWCRSGLLALAVALTRKEHYVTLRDRCAARAAEGLHGRGPVDDGQGTGAGDHVVCVDRDDRADELVAAREGGAGVRVRSGDEIPGAGVDDGRQAGDRRARAPRAQLDLFDVARP